MQRTILLADDSPTIRRLVTQTFAESDFHVVEVNNGDAAIRSFEEVEPSVILADIYMPGKNGYEVRTYVRNHERLGRTPVVLLVGAFEAFDEDTAKKAGATASITKPFEPGALIELVKSVMLPDNERPLDPFDEEPLEPVALAVPELPAPSDSLAEAPGTVAGETDDLFGLATIFTEDPAASGARTGSLSEEDLERIADRVIQRLSTQVIESIAWEVVPDITERVVRDELKRVK